MGFGQAIDHVADIGSGPAHVQEAGARNVRHCLDVQIGFKHRDNFFDVDAGRFEQLFSNGSSEFAQVFVHAPILNREEDPARQRQAIAVHARGAQSHNDVAIPGVPAGEDSRKINGANGGAHEIERVAFAYAVDHFPDLSDFSTRNGYLGELRALVQSLNELTHEVVVRGFDGNIVQQRYGSGADAEHVIDVHGDTVDTDGVVFVHHVGDNNFRADSVGRYGDTGTVSKINDVGEVTQR